MLAPSSSKFDLIIVITITTANNPTITTPTGYSCAWPQCSFKIH